MGMYESCTKRCRTGSVSRFVSSFLLSTITGALLIVYSYFLFYFPFLPLSSVTEARAGMSLA